VGTALRKQEDLSAQLEAERTSLERRVEERSSDLQKRVRQFEVASEIAREVSAETTLENLLNSAVNLIRDGFGFYHVGVFLTDERNQFAVLRAATGEAGRAMIERNHRLKIGEVGMVGFVVSRGEARIALDVAADTVHFKNPLLPDTRSEMVLPLRHGSRTFGALDVQSVLDNAFAQEDIGILQTIADQLAVAFEKTRLVEELQRNIAELEANYQASTQKAWKSHLRGARQKVAYRYHDSRVDGLVEESEHSLEALNSGEMVTRIEPGHGKPVTVLAVPIKLRNQVLGVVDIHFESTNISPDLISLIEGTVNRLAVSLENARLLEEIQARAERERLVSDISSKVRAASDVDSVLQIAIQEIGRSLGVAEVMVQLRKDT
jgi:GAF domain-containing protein